MLAKYFTRAYKAPQKIRQRSPNPGNFHLHLYINPHDRQKNEKKCKLGAIRWGDFFVKHVRSSRFAINLRFSKKSVLRENSRGCELEFGGTEFVLKLQKLSGKRRP